MAHSIVALLLLPTRLLLANSANPLFAPGLTEETFDDFVGRHSVAMVDFVEGQTAHVEELVQADRVLMRLQHRVPMARVNIQEHPQLGKRYFRGCDHEKRLCADSFPRVLWFVDGQATPYHRGLETGEHLANFVMAMDRKPIVTVESTSDLQFNRYLLFTGEQSSATYRTLELIAGRHMDTMAAAHIESPGSRNISWVVEDDVVGTYVGDDDEASVENWVRTHFAFGEDAPEKALQDDGGVLVVASTFEDQVLRNDTDVFILVYAPFCGYSRKVLPEWSRFARAVSAGSVDNLVVAQMDGEQNLLDTQEHKVTSFPTFLYFKAGVKSPLRYEGARTSDAFVTFAQKHQPFATNESVAMFQPKLRGRKGFLSRVQNSGLDL